MCKYNKKVAGYGACDFLKIVYGFLFNATTDRVATSSAVLPTGF
jgi:hypothetical protein